jgi:hypothetical protein
MLLTMKEQIARISKPQVLASSRLPFNLMDVFLRATRNIISPTVTLSTYQSSLGYGILYDANSSTVSPRILLKAIPSETPLINTTPNQSEAGENNSAHSSAE